MHLSRSAVVASRKNLRKTGYWMDEATIARLLASAVPLIAVVFSRWRVRVSSYQPFAFSGRGCASLGSLTLRCGADFRSLGVDYEIHFVLA